MAMRRKDKIKNNNPSSTPPVVSTNCSSLQSLYRSFRSNFSCSNLSSHRYLPINPTSRKTTPSSSSSRSLEHELAKLDELLTIEDKTIVDGVNSEMEPATNGNNVVRLVDGGYLFALSEDLSMQVSAPALIPVEIGSSFSQVINRMATMGRDNLIKWLLKSMPMCDLSKSQSKKVYRNDVPSACPEEGFLEAILMEGVEKLDILALEGLKAQVSGKMKVNKSEKTATRSKKKVEFEVGDCLMEVMLIQMRNPNKGYERVGETMIGFIEARLGEKYERSFWFQGIYVAGTCGGDRNECGYLWSVSIEGNCRRSSSNRILRNNDIAFTS